MQAPPTDRTAYRFRRCPEPPGKRQDKPRGYRTTYALLDEQSQRTVAQADLVGQAVFAHTRITDEAGAYWTLRPNRKLMPSRWLLNDEQDRLAFQFDQKLAGKLTNPLYSTVLAVLDGEGGELMRLVNLHSKKPSFVVGLDLGKYALVRGETALAGLSTLPRESTGLRKGFFGRLGRFMAPSDWALVSLADEHPLPPPAALAMYLLYRELTDRSGG